MEGKTRPRNSINSSKITSVKKVSALTNNVFRLSVRDEITVLLDWPVIFKFCIATWTNVNQQKWVF